MTVPSLERAVSLGMGLPYTCSIFHPPVSPPVARLAESTASDRSNTRGLHRQKGGTGAAGVGKGAPREMSSTYERFNSQYQVERQGG